MRQKNFPAVHLECLRAVSFVFLVYSATSCRSQLYKLQLCSSSSIKLLRTRLVLTRCSNCSVDRYLSERCSVMSQLGTTWFLASRLALSSKSVIFYRWSVKMITTGGRHAAGARPLLIQRGWYHRRNCRSGERHVWQSSVLRRSTQASFYCSHCICVEHINFYIVFMCYTCCPQIVLTTHLFQIVFNISHLFFKLFLALIA